MELSELGRTPRDFEQALDVSGNEEDSIWIVSTKDQSYLLGGPYHVER